MDVTVTSENLFIQIKKITVKTSELMNINAMLVPFFSSQEKSVLLQSVWKTQKVNRFATRCGKDRIFCTKAAVSRKHRLAVLCLGEKKKLYREQSNKCEKTKQNWRNRKTEAVSDQHCAVCEKCYLTLSYTETCLQKSRAVLHR